MTPEVRQHSWVMKFVTFSSQLTLLTVELITALSNLIRPCRRAKMAPLQNNHSLSLSFSSFLSICLILFLFSPQFTFSLSSSLDRSHFLLISLYLFLISLSLSLEWNGWRAGTGVGVGVAGWDRRSARWPLSSNWRGCQYVHRILRLS